MEIRRDSLCVRFTEYSRQCMRTLFWRMCHLSHCRIIARAPDARSRRHTRAGAARRSGAPELPARRARARPRTSVK